jgi:hypothetical protein
MLGVEGTYYSKGTVVAFRNDYCLTCQGKRTAFLRRMFQVAHMLFVPVLPLGYVEKWRCSDCGNDPHRPVHPSRTSQRVLLWVGVLLIPGFLLLAPSKPGEGPAWAALWLPLAMIFFATRELIRRRGEGKDVNLAEKLRSITPSSDPNCPLCEVALHQTAAAWRCPNCHLARR